jgi:hypothetical protein
LDPAEAAGRSIRVIPERFRKELETPVSERSNGEREGLPPNYRMRADAHYVDQLIARAPDMAVRFISTDEIDGGGEVDRRSIEALAESIRTHGVLQPLLVRRDASRYRIIFGRRRLAAALLAGLRNVPCVVHQIDAKPAEDLAVAERTEVAEGAPAASTKTALDADALLTQLGREVAGIESAAAILAGDPLPTVRRVTLDLIRSHASRTAWLVQATDLLTNHDRTESRRLCLLGPLLEQARIACLAEARLNGVSIDVCVPDWNVSAVVDDRALTAGLAGAIVSTLGLLERSDDAIVTLMLASGASDEPPSIHIGQEAVAVPAEFVNRFFDPAWTSRPGGWPAHVGARLVQAVARRHGGDALVQARTAKGSTIKLALGR